MRRARGNLYHVYSCSFILGALGYAMVLCWGSSGALFRGVVEAVVRNVLFYLSST